jgi:hypothetical protein
VQQASIVIMNLTEKGSAFGHLLENGETVFIPANVMKAARAEELGTYTANLIPNRYRDDVPWMAIFVYRAEETRADGSFDLPEFITNRSDAANKGLIQ